MTPTPEQYIDQFHKQALRTVRIVRLFEDRDLALCPGEGSMSTAGQFQHICGCHNFVRGVLEDKTVTNELFKKPFDVSSVAAAVRSLGAAIGEVQRAARSVTPQMWAERISPFGPDWEMSRGEMCWLMIDHEVHHRGQLTVYARIAGKTPGMLYSPVDEGVLHL